MENWSIAEGQIDNASFTNDYSDSLTFSELGCTLSHIRAIRKAYDNGDQLVLICEDDASFELSKLWPANLVQKLSREMNTGIMQLCWNFDIRNQQFCSFENEYAPTSIAPGGWCWSTVAYLISRKGMKDVLEYCGYLAGTHIHIRKTQGVTRAVADKYLYKTTTVSTGT